MKKLLLCFAVLSLILSGCTEFDDFETAQIEENDDYYSSAVFSSDYTSSPDAIYSLRNVQKAFDLISGEQLTRAFALQPTHHYVRFLPQSESDISPVY